MKSLKITTLALLATTALTAQDLRMDEVPSDMMAKFQEAYPQATDVEWEKEGNDYKVEYEINGEDHEVWYSADGNTAKMERDIMEDELPEAVRSAISNTYADYKIDSVEMTEEGDKITYEVELEKGWNDEKKVIFDADGNVISEMDD